MPSSEAVARYFLHLAASESERTVITQMHLHKLLYYAQGWSFGMRERALFDGRLEAWTHGPVVVDVRAKFQSYRDEEISSGEARLDPALSREDRELIEWVWDRYSAFSAKRLRDMTHRERPWREARGALAEGEPSNAAISEACLREFFIEQHRLECAKHGIDRAKLKAGLADAKAGRTISLDELKHGLRA